MQKPQYSRREDAFVSQDFLIVVIDTVMVAIILVAWREKKETK